MQSRLSASRARAFPLWIKTGVAGGGVCIDTALFAGGAPSQSITQAAKDPMHLT
jgi:hypothetical protein